MNETPDPFVLTPEDREDRLAFGRALQRLRTRSGLSLRRLEQACAEVHRVSRGTIEHWGKGGIVSAANEPAFACALRAMGVSDDAAVDDWISTAQALRTQRAKPPAAEPYRGLRSYDAESAAVFHGRAALVEEVLGRIELIRATGGLLVLTGASGTGKSSLLNAGVLPALAAGSLPDSGSWPVLALSAESHEPHALAALARAVAAHLRDDPETVLHELQSGTDSIKAICRRIVSMPRERSASRRSPSGGHARFVVVVDQFERAVVSAEDGPGSEESLAAFITVLGAMATAPDAAVVLVGVRLDFLDAVVSHRTIRRLMRERPPVFVGPMDEGDLSQVIERPSRAFGVVPEPGFVEKVLGDVSARGGRSAHQAGVLPLLSHALQMTWARSAGKEMTLVDYAAAGGVEGALRSTAESTYTGLSPAQQAVARRVFLCLVHVQPTGAATRRRVSQDDLFMEVGGEQADVDLVLDRFVARRLLIIDDGVEIAHEALIAAWPELRDWLDAGRGARLVAQQVSADAREWDQSGRPGADLYSATRLEAARQWRQNHPADSGKLTRAFIDASVRRSRHRVQLVWGTIAVLVALLCVAATLSLVTSHQASDLERQRNEAQSRSLAVQSSILRSKDVNLARQLALVAYRISPTVEARSALMEATALAPAVRMLGGDRRRIMYAVGIHPGGRVVAAASQGSVRLWDVSAASRPRALPPAPGPDCGKIYALAFSPHGNVLAASCDGGSIHLWNTSDPTAPVALPPLTGLGTNMYSVVFSRDGATMATAGARARVKGGVSGTVQLWSVAGTSLQPLGGAVRAAKTSAVKSVAFHPSGRALAVGSDDGSVAIWDISRPRRMTSPVSAAAGTKAVGQLAFSPDGRLLAAGGADNLVRLWSTADPREPAVAGEAIDGSSSYINAVAFSPDSRTLAIAGSDSNTGLRLVDLSNRRVTATLPHPSPVTSVKFRPDGRQVITGANDGAARLWSVDSLALAGLDYTLSAARFSPDGRTLALGSADLRLFDIADPQYPKLLGRPRRNADAFSGTLAYSSHASLLAEGHGKSGTVQLWDTTAPARPTPYGPPLQAHSAQVETIAFSPDDTMLATGGREGEVRLWDVRTPRAPTRLSTPGTFPGFVNQVAFSPDGEVLAAGSTNKTVRLFDISAPRTPRPLGSPLTPGDHYVYAVTFSPDGSMLAVGLADGTVHLYDVSDVSRPRRLTKPLAGPEGYVLALAFAPRGSSLAATGGDGTVWVWNLSAAGTPTRYATLRMSSGALYPAHFHPRRPLLVSGGDEKRAWLWTTDPDEAGRLICDTTGDRITREEWDKYLPVGFTYAPPCP
ncbi:nSTAND1 domain-containing NTPase [Streptomyces lichenis]|uniref:AAA family ATPase n=1 Tax=Streptomyces lichenis TaxID=2306967 RepID=A0ABT0IAT8_9ACTN|nr:AAA family ATPase [Streptomyces lichenis]MCK8678414.1 AAA family ATPase [Streptomyces lichenis]